MAGTTDIRSVRMTRLDRRWCSAGGRLRYAVLAFFAAAGILGFPVAAVAHDPGLSSLELRVGPSDIAADLSCAGIQCLYKPGNVSEIVESNFFRNPK